MKLSASCFVAPGDRHIPMALIGNLLEQDRIIDIDNQNTTCGAASYPGIFSREKAYFLKGPLLVAIILPFLFNRNLPFNPD